METTWTGVATLGVIIAGAIACALAGQSELATLFGGAAVGILAPQPIRRVIK